MIRILVKFRLEEKRERLRTQEVLQNCGGLSMDEIQSGKELCDQFFGALSSREDIDQKVAMLLKNLYSEGKLTGDNILRGLETLRMEKEDEGESQT